jgi:threonine dehydrogenase-like Zn-dependent dehydrogenase
MSARVGGLVVELVAPGRLEPRRHPVPSPGPGEALVRTRSVGICGTDLHAFRGRADALPIVLGHDMSGRVEAVGDGVDPSWVGRRVTVDPTVACGRCPWCRARRPALCPRGGYLGMTVPGALAERLVVAARQLVALPDQVSDRAATVIEPVVVALRLLELAAPLLAAPGPAAVVGGGPLGLVLARVLESRGWSVAVLEPVPARRALGADMGLQVLPPGPVDLGEGPRLVVETSAHPDGLALARELALAGSVLGLVGRAPADLPAPEILLRELAVLGVRGGPGHYPEAVALVAGGTVDPAMVITHAFALDEAPAAFATAADPAAGVVRAVLESAG